MPSCSSRRRRRLTNDQKNPFKFLESYEASRRRRVHRTRRRYRDLPRGARQANPQVIIVPGPPKAGKTSLVRAGLIPALDVATHAGVYVRCQPALEKTLRAELWPDRPNDPPAGFAGVFSRLAADAAASALSCFSTSSSVRHWL